MTQPLWASLLDDFQFALGERDGRDRLCGLPPLAEQDRTWKERAAEVCLRAKLLAEWADRDDLDSLELAVDALGAQLLAIKLALHAARETRIP